MDPVFPGHQLPYEHLLPLSALSPPIHPQAPGWHHSATSVEGTAAAKEGPPHETASLTDCNSQENDHLSFSPSPIQSTTRVTRIS